MTATQSPEQVNAEATARRMGRRKGASLNPGRPRHEAAHLPTAGERDAFVAGWYEGR